MVAVKVLPSHLSENPELRQRFEREARAISQLSHPHICALYDVGRQDGLECLVTEWQYDVASDGSRFLFVLPARGKSASPSIDLVTDWTAALSK